MRTFCMKIYTPKYKDIEQETDPPNCMRVTRALLQCEMTSFCRAAGILRHGNVAISSVVINDVMTSEAHFNGLEAWEKWIFLFKIHYFPANKGYDKYKTALACMKSYSIVNSQ